MSHKPTKDDIKFLDETFKEDREGVTLGAMGLIIKNDSIESWSAAFQAMYSYGMSSYRQWLTNKGINVLQLEGREVKESE